MNNILVHIDRDCATNLASAYNICSINRILVHASTIPQYKNISLNVYPDLRAIDSKIMYHFSMNTST
ncbi:hypothetical protein D3C71_1660220 [compost metagenome]